MYSRSLTSVVFAVALFLLAFITPTASALPGRTVGQVVAENHNMACRIYSCWNKNDTNTTDAVAAADAAAANRTESPVADHPFPANLNGASSLYQHGVILPAIVSGSLLLLL